MSGFILPSGTASRCPKVSGKARCQLAIVNTIRAGDSIMSIVPSIIVLVITALIVFRRDFTGRPAAPASKPTPGGKRRQAAGFLEASDDGGDGREPVAAVVFVDDGRHSSPHSCVRVAVHETSSRRGPCAMGRTERSPWCGFSPDAGNSKWGAGNLLTGAPSGPFASGRTYRSRSLSTASSRSADHPIATG